MSNDIKKDIKEEYNMDRKSMDTIDGDLATLNLGPTHPATHGIFENVLTIDGEKILDAVQTVGYIHRAFEKMLAPTKTPTSILRFLTVPVNNLFVTKLEEYNAIFGQQQVENIYQTIMLIENKHNQERIDIMIKNNVQKNIPYTSCCSTRMMLL